MIDERYMNWWSTSLQFLAMTFINNNPSFWPLVSLYRVESYYTVASSVAVIYDWVLTFGREFDLVWRQRWSFVTVLYFGVRYIGLLYIAIQIAPATTSTPLTDTGCELTHYSDVHLVADLLGTVLVVMKSWLSMAGNVMLGIIMITRLHAMYQQSRRITVFLILIFSALTITSVVIAIIQSKSFKLEEVILSGTYQCVATGDWPFLTGLTWILGMVWEVLALCLAVWIAIKHFRQLPTGWTIGDCFTVLIKYHVLYFVLFAVVACLAVGDMSSLFSGPEAASVGAEFYTGILQVLSPVGMFVLGPRLILSIREYNAKVVADSDEGTVMTSLAFHERTLMSIGSGV